MPSKVKVGPLIYDIEVVARLLQRGEERSGEADHGIQVIRILEGYPPSGRWQLFWHECLHALDEVAETRLKEDQVSRLGNYLAAFMVDNGFYEIPEETEDERKSRIARAEAVQDERENVRHY